MKVIYSIILAVWISTNFVIAQNTNNLELFASGLIKPVCITNAGDDRLFVVNQQGIISSINPEGIINPATFLDIRDRVTYGGERGLLGLAFHPQYQSNGYFFVNYVGKGDSTHISRFKVSAANQNMADPQSELKLLTIFQPYANHNGGDLKFGPDGYLYIGLGDGGSGGDPGNRAQNPKVFLGKMLRIDIDHGVKYSIPESNPFYKNAGFLPEIWALGLRNPWRFSFDRLTGDLWIADVGQNAYEEIDFQPANSPGGENYGWRCYEGNNTYNTSQCTSAANLTFPVYVYPQGDDCSVTGGYVYRASTASPFYGHYFFADYCSDRIWTLHQESGNWIKKDFGRFSGNNFSTFGEDFQGQLYVAGLYSGKIFRINDLSTNSDRLRKITETSITRLSGKKYQLFFSGNIQTVIRIELYGLNGIKQYQNEAKATSHLADFNHLPSGIYFLSVKINSNTETFKLILTD